MASLTIRKLDDAIKTYLRLRSAGNGRSVEEEVRVILGELHTGAPLSAGSPASVRGSPGANPHSPPISPAHAASP